MAIGTEVKVGWDASAVKAGMASMTGMFSAFSKKLGSGIKAGMVAGGLAGATAIGLGLKAASGVKELADYVGDLKDMEAQTGLSIEKLMELQSALRMAGVPIEDTSKLLSRFASSMYEARSGSGAALDALHRLGFLASEFEGKKLDEQFNMIAKAVAALPPEFEGLEDVMEDLFGAKMGYGLQRLFKAPENFEKSRKAFSRLNAEIAKDADDLDHMSERIDIMRDQFRGLSLIAFRFFRELGAFEWMDKLFDQMSFEKILELANKIKEKWISIRDSDVWASIVQGIKDAAEFITKLIADIREKGIGTVISDSFSEAFKGVGAKIGQGISEALDIPAMGIKMGQAIMETIRLPSLSELFGFGSSKASKGNDKSTSYLEGIQQSTRESVRLLGRIEQDGFVARLA